MTTLFGFATDQQNRYIGIRVQQSVYGVAIPVLFGRNRLTANLVWYGDFEQHAQAPGTSDKSGGKGTPQDYTAAIQAILCKPQVIAIGQIWNSNGQLLYVETSETVTIPNTANPQYAVTQAANFRVDSGASMAASYSVTANDFGSDGSVTLSGTQQVPMSAVTGTPARGEYVVTPPITGGGGGGTGGGGGGVYTFNPADAGETVTITYTYEIPEPAGENATASCTLNGSGEVGSVTLDSTGANYSVSPTVVFFGGGGSGAAAVCTLDNFYKVATITLTAAGSGYVEAPQVLLVGGLKYISEDYSFELIEGTAGQAPWSYMTSNHPTQALAYNRIAMIAAASMDLGSTATMPNFSFEAQSSLTFGGGVPDCLPTVIANFILADPYTGVLSPGTYTLGNWAAIELYCQANSIFFSPVYQTATATSSILQNLAKLTNSEWLQSEGMLKWVPYGDTTVVGNGATYTPPAPEYDLGLDDFLAKAGESPVQVELPDLYDNTNWVTISYTDRNAAYNTTIAQARDEASINTIGLRPNQGASASEIVSSTVAQTVANLLLKRAAYPFATYKFKLGMQYGLLEPMDLVTLTEPELGFSKLPVRIKKIDEQTDRSFQIEAEDFPWGVAQPTQYPTQATYPPPLPGIGGAGPVNAPVIFESPDSFKNAGAGYELCVGVSGQAANYGGCALWVAAGSTDYQLSQANVPQARTGNLKNSVPAVQGLDTTSTITVDLGECDGVLTGGTAALPNPYSTLSVLVDAATGNFELFSYERATLVSGNVYNLTYLQRGLYGTTGQAHVAGARFLRVDSAAQRLDFSAADAGIDASMKFLSYNSVLQTQQSLSSVEPYVYPISGYYNNFDQIMSTTVQIIASGTGTAPYTTGQIVVQGISTPQTQFTITKSDGVVFTVQSAVFTGLTLSTTTEVMVYAVMWNPMLNTISLEQELGLLPGHVYNGLIYLGSATMPYANGNLPAPILPPGATITPVLPTTLPRGIGDAPTTPQIILDPNFQQGSKYWSFAAGYNTTQYIGCATLVDVTVESPIFASPKFAVTPGSNYQISAIIAGQPQTTPAAGTGYVFFNWYNSAGTMLSQTIGNVITGTMANSGGGGVSAIQNGIAPATAVLLLAGVVIIPPGNGVSSGLWTIRAVQGEQATLTSLDGLSDGTTRFAGADPISDQTVNRVGITQLTFPVTGSVTIPAGTSATLGTLTFTSTSTSDNFLLILTVPFSGANGSVEISANSSQLGFGSISGSSNPIILHGASSSIVAGSYSVPIIFFNQGSTAITVPAGQCTAILQQIAAAGGFNSSPAGGAPVLHPGIA